MKNVFYGTVNKLYGLLHKDGKCSVANKLWSFRHPNRPLDKKNKEYNSWVNSLPPLINDIYLSGLGSLDLLMEYSTKTNGHRIDAVLLGYDHSNIPKALLIENKQWSDISPKDFNKSDVLNLLSEENNPHHPINQVLEYRHDLLQNNSGFNDHHTKLITAVCTFNLQHTDILYSERYNKYYWFKNNVFGSQDHSHFESFLKKNFINKENCNLLSKAIQAQHNLSVADINGIYNIFEKDNDSKYNVRLRLNATENATMIADQQYIDDFIMRKIREHFIFRHQHNKDYKELLIISGFAGTGKTILGLHAIFDYIHYATLHHVHINKYTDAVYTLARNLVIWNYVNDNGKGIRIPYLQDINKDTHLLVIDEAHRISNVKHTMEYIFDCKDANLVIVLQDDHQRIDANDEGTVENFTRFVKYYNESHDSLIKYSDNNHKMLTIQKRSQFNGTLASRNSLVNAINFLFNRIQFPVYICDSLNDMKCAMQRYNQRGLTKFVAPLCWGWTNPSNHDIKIKDHDGSPIHFYWNPPKSGQAHWLRERHTSKRSLFEVACIFTSQGMDFNYVGAIWWDDLVWDKNKRKWTYNISECSYEPFVNHIREKYGIPTRIGNRIIKVIPNDDPRITRLFLNIYGILLTRAQKGMLIWFKDFDTEEHVKDVLNLHKWSLS